MSPVIHARNSDVSYAISTVYLFNILAVLSFPLIGHALGMTPHAFGLFAGTAVRLDVMKRHRLAKLDAERKALFQARDHGTFDADVLESALANLDASQIAIEMRGPAG